MSTALKIAIFQMSAAADPATHPDRIEAAMRRARDAGADLLIAPELAMTGYGRGKALQYLAQPADGPWVQRMERAAQQIGIGLVVGFPERDGDQCFISAMAVNLDEAAPVIYRKSYLYGPYEKALFANDRVSVVTADFGGLKLGFLICYDVEFPENVRRLAQAGVDLVVVPTALPRGDDGLHIVNRTVPVRAYENQIFVAYADLADADDQFEYQGMSCIAAPDGAMLATAGMTGETLIFAEIDPAAYAQCRDRNPYLADLAQVIGPGAG